METGFSILIILIHAYTIYDALKNFSERHGGFRLVLAFIPPLIGPLFYFLTKNSKNTKPRKRGFMEGKTRFNRNRRR